jgi:hypothetical protein
MPARTSRGAFGTVQIAGAAGLCAVTVNALFRTASVAENRDHFGAFGSAMLTPWLVLLPLAIVLLTCTPFSSDLAHRFIAVQRLRRDVRRQVAARLGAAAAGGFALAFLLAFVPYLLAFHLWPLIGDPGIDPAGYGFTPEQAAQYSYQQTGFGAVLRIGDLPFGLVFSAWNGLCGAVYAAMGITSLLLIRNRFLALASPMLLVFGQTFLAAVLGQPRLAIYYSATAYGLSYDSDLQMMLPVLVLAVVTALTAAACVYRAPDSGRLS